METENGKTSLESRSLAELEAIFEHASIGIAFTINRVFTRCNNAMETAIGYPTVVTRTDYGLV
jgi:PAS domain-containing protein